MIKYQTLPQMLDDRARGAGAIGYLEGENAEKSLKLADLRRRALGILFHLQKLGAKPGDKLILHVASNEQFIDAFWACLYGGIVPVPVAVGISDEHKHKLLRIARQLGSPYLYTDRKLRDRLRDVRHRARRAASLDVRSPPRTFLIDQLDDISREGTPAKLSPGPDGVHPVLVGLDQRAQGRRADAPQHPRERRRFAARGAGSREEDVSLSWMPLTHDMGLIGFHLMMMYAGARQYLMPTDLFVRRALLWLKFASAKRVTLTCSPNFGYRHFLRALGDKTLEGLDLSSRAADLQRRRADFRRARRRIPRPPGALRPAAHVPCCPVYGLAEASLAVALPASRIGCTATSRSIAARSASGATARHVGDERPERAQADVRGQADSLHQREAAGRRGRRGRPATRSVTC